MAFSSPPDAVLLACADPTRRAVLHELRSGDRTVSELFVRTGASDRMSQPAFSQQIRRLREADLVRQHKKGRERVCTLHAIPIKQIAAWAAHFERFWDDRLDALAEHLDGSDA